MTVLAGDIQSILDNLESQVRTQIAARKLTSPLMIGIHSGGVWIAEHLHQRLALDEALGLLDISFYRDDFSHVGMHPKVRPSQMPPNVTGRDIILVDDVFFTGRTARAALNEIFDYGRPEQVLLAVLIERDGREIPLRPDCSGINMTLQKGQRVKLTGPQPLGIQIYNIENSNV